MPEIPDIFWDLGLTNFANVVKYYLCRDIETHKARGEPFVLLRLFLCISYV